MFEIIGVDMANENSNDYSATVYVCGNCKSVINFKTYDHDDNEISITLYKKCPFCNQKFSGYKINNC